MSNLINKWNEDKDNLVKEELKAITFHNKFGISFSKYDKDGNEVLNEDGKRELLLIRETKPRWKDKNESIHIYYRDKNLVHKKSLIKLAKYFRIGERNSKDKIKYSFSNVARDIIEEYLNRDDIKELLEQIDKEDTNE